MKKRIKRSIRAVAVKGLSLFIAGLFFINQLAFAFPTSSTLRAVSSNQTNIVPSLVTDLKTASAGLTSEQVVEIFSTDWSKKYINNAQDVENMAKLVRALVESGALEAFPDAEWKFMLFSAAPGTGKDYVFARTFGEYKEKDEETGIERKKPGIYFHLVKKGLLYHTRNYRKKGNEKDGKAYHFRSAAILEYLQKQGKIILAWVNRQLQGWAMNNFTEPGVVVKDIIGAGLLQKDDVIIYADIQLADPKKAQSDSVLTVKVDRNGHNIDIAGLGIKNDQSKDGKPGILIKGDRVTNIDGDSITVDREILGLESLLNSKQLGILEGGYGWFLSLERAGKAGALKVFIAPFSKVQIKARTHFREWIENFPHHYQRLIAHLMVSDAVKAKQTELDKFTKAEIFSLKNSIKEKTQALDEPSARLIVEEYYKEQASDVMQNSEIIESPEFIDDLNERLVKDFGKTSIEPNRVSESRMLAYEINRRLVDRDPIYKFGRNADAGKEEYDRYNRVLEGIVQILYSEEYGEDNIVVNEWSFTDEQKAENNERLKTQFPGLFFRHVLKGLSSSKANDLIAFKTWLEQQGIAVPSVVNEQIASRYKQELDNRLCFGSLAAGLHNITYSDLEESFAKGMDTAFDLSKPSGQRFSGEAQSIAKFMDDALSLFEDLAKSNDSLRKYMTQRMQGSQNQYGITTRVSKSIPVDMSRYYNRETGNVEIVVNEKFIRGFMDAPQQYARITQLMFAIRLLHELGHENVANSIYERMRREYELLKKDIEPYSLLGTNFIDQVNIFLKEQPSFIFNSYFRQLKVMALNKLTLVPDFDRAIEEVGELEKAVRDIFADRHTSSINDEMRIEREKRIEKAFQLADSPNAVIDKYLKMQEIEGTFLGLYANVLSQRAIVAGGESFMFLANDPSGVLPIPLEHLKHPRVGKTESSRWARQYYAFHKGLTFADGISVTEAENGRGYQQKFHKHETTEQTVSLCDHTEVIYARRAADGEIVPIDKQAQTSDGIPLVIVGKTTAKFGEMIRMPKGFFHTLNNPNLDFPSRDFTTKEPLTRIIKEYAPSYVPVLQSPEIIGRTHSTWENVYSKYEWGEEYKHYYGMYASRLLLEDDGDMQYVLDNKGKPIPVMDNLVSLTLRLFTVIHGQTTQPITHKPLYGNSQFIRVFPWPKNITNKDWEIDSDRKKIKGLVRVFDKQGALIKAIDVSGGDIVMLDNPNMGDFSVENISDVTDYELTFFVLEPKLGPVELAQLKASSSGTNLNNLSDYDAQHHMAEFLLNYAPTGIISVPDESQAVIVYSDALKESPALQDIIRNTTSGSRKFFLVNKEDNISADQFLYSLNIDRGLFQRHVFYKNSMNAEHLALNIAGTLHNQNIKQGRIFASTQDDLTAWGRQGIIEALVMLLKDKKFEIISDYSEQHMEYIKSHQQALIAA
jgi:hypothetical protein